MGLAIECPRDPGLKLPMLRLGPRRGIPKVKISEFLVWSIYNMFSEF